MEILHRLDNIENCEVVLNEGVDAFTDRLKDLVAIKGEEKVREAWPTCLKGVVQQLYSTELTSLEKEFMRGGTVERMSIALISRFKESGSMALNALQTEKFTFADARQHKSLRGNAQSMFRHAKAAEMTCPIPRGEKVLDIGHRISRCKMSTS